MLTISPYGGNLSLNREEGCVMASIFDVAKCILDIKGTVSSYELQKLCYYCQAWSLALGEGAMFSEKFEAWPHGPVCRALFAAHKGEFHVKNSDIAKGNIDNIPPKMKDVILSVLDIYSGLSGKDLEHLTHTEDPWINARHGLPEAAYCSETISEDIMRDYYRNSDNCKHHIGCIVPCVFFAGRQKRT